jgi:hypothetical protein
MEGKEAEEAERLKTQALTLLVFGRFPFRISAGTSTIRYEVFRVCSLFPQAIAGIVT